MSRSILLALALLAPVTLIAAVGTDSASSPFVESFDGTPTAITPWDDPGWDITYDADEVDTRIAPGNLSDHAQHGAGCTAPTNTHVVENLPGVVYQCNGHVMTALDAPGYSAVYLTPDRLLDFSGGATATLTFDISTEISSTRDWWDLWLTPYGSNVQLVGEDWYPDLNGLPKDGVLVGLNGGNIGAKIIENYAYRQQNVSGPSDRVQGNWWTRYSDFLTPDRARRDTIQIDISRTHLKIGMPAYNFYWVDTDIAPLPFDQVTVQFGHHSYNPTKDCAYQQAPSQCLGNTWHWDQVTMNPSKPITIIEAVGNEFTGNSPQRITFESSAPANAEVRFTAVQLSNTEISFNEGATWQPATRTQSGDLNKGKLFSYRMPVPAGQTSVLVRGQTNLYGQPWIVRDPSIWANAADATTPTTTVPTTVPATTPPTTVPVTTPPTTIPPTTTTTTAPEPPTCVIGPSNVTQMTVTTRSVMVMWEGRSGARFEIRYRRVGATAWNVRDAGAATSYTATGLTAGVVYEFQAREVTAWVPAA